MTDEVIVTHWRVVRNAEPHGIPFSVSDREMRATEADDTAKRWAERIGDCHIEVWEQTYTVSPSTWERILTNPAPPHE